MKRKNVKVAVNVFFSKKCYQVALSKKEQDYILELITQMHEGKIKILKEELPLKLK